MRREDTMERIRETASGEAVFRIEGRFDQPAAIRLRQRVMAEEATRVILDFSHAENLDHAALPLLTIILILLRRKGRDAALLGLRGHQLRVLYYLGIEVSGGGWAKVLGVP
jgi:anti-anti-sigma regulatory factor